MRLLLPAILLISILSSESVPQLCTQERILLGSPKPVAGHQNQTSEVGKLSASGRVTVNAQKVTSGSSVPPGSIITTATNSTAVVSFDYLGRVEILPSSSLSLSFDEKSVTVTLNQGRIRLSNPTGVAAKVITEDGEIVSATDQANAFTVDVECGNTVAATQIGRVELRVGDNVKQIGAGSQDTAGTARPGTRCTRLRTEGMRASKSRRLISGIKSVFGKVLRPRKKKKN